MIRTQRAEHSGPRALQWLHQQQLEVDDVPSEAEARISFDRIETDEFIAGRIWQTPMTMRYAPRPWADNFSLVLLALAGRRNIEIDGATYSMESPEVLVLVEPVPFIVRTTEVTAGAFFWVPRRRLHPWADDMPKIQPFRAGAAFHATTISAAMAALNFDLDARSPAHKTWALGMQHLVLALVQDSLQATIMETWPPLAREARRIAREHAPDRNFSVAKLAQALEISPTHLHRVMQPTGVTAGQLIRQQRLHLATELLTGQKRTRSELERVASLTGFPSGRSLRVALAQQGSPQRAAATLESMPSIG